MNKDRWFSTVVIGALLVGLLPFGAGSPQSYAQGNSRTFPETSKTVKGHFLEYWNQNGGLPQQGYPISAEIKLTSDTDSKTYKEVHRCHHDFAE